MIEVLLKCGRCDEEIAVDMDLAVLRTDEEPRPAAELLFVCPACREPGLRQVTSDLLALLLLVGVEPLRLSEPALPPEDVPPLSDPLTRNDLLAWHELLSGVHFVTPWEG